MNDLNIFFNTTAVLETSFMPSQFFIKCGDACFTPVRCLFNGNLVTISNLSSLTCSIKTDKEEFNKGRKNPLTIAISIILLIPGVIIGSAFKGLGYLSSYTRKCHVLIRSHNRLTELLLQEQGPTSNPVEDSAPSVQPPIRDPYQDLRESIVAAQQELAQRENDLRELDKRMTALENGRRIAARGNNQEEDSGGYLI
jgi:hypothetical protein